MSTKERILDAAEQLFADQGFAATSLRTITAAAGVNLAAVNYHFGSKEALIEAAFSRRLAPINRERLERLDRLESADAAPTVEQVVEAFIAPPLFMCQQWRPGATVTRMLGQAMIKPDVQELFMAQFTKVFQRFTAALTRLLPDLPDEEVLWRFLFMVGSMAYTMALSREYHRLCEGRCGAVDVETTIGRLVPFVSAGLRAPLPVRDAGGAT